MSYQNWSDFRSDTVTRPTAAMRQAMAEAEVGDDVLGDDPTVRVLEETAAGIMHKEAALFVPSGTMGNTIALIVHGSRKREVLLEGKSHIYNFECGNIGHLVGAIPRPLLSAAGQIAISELENHHSPGPDAHQVATAGVALETTHNYHGGAILPLAYLKQVQDFCRKKKIFLHLDGARVFNAAVALNVPVHEIAQFTDSVMFCLSKGLGAPVGSLLVGTADFIRAAHDVRKQLGGGMRQVGILAAAGIIGLRQMTQRLVEDHKRARQLAEAIAEIPNLVIDPAAVQTNIVIFGLVQRRLSATELVQRLQSQSVLALPFGPGRIRMVTHYDIDDQDIAKAKTALRTAMST